MELGLDFDDDLFTTKEKSSTPANDSAYVAKRCEPLWFLGDEPTDDEFEKLQFGADHFFYQKRFEEALAAYRACLVQMPKNSVFFQKILNESCARCLIQLKQFNDAEIISSELVNQAQNFEQMTAALQLMVDLQHAKQNWTEEVSRLEELLVLHPNNIHLWHKLGTCLSRLGSQQAAQLSCLQCLALLSSIESTGHGFGKEKIDSLRKQATELKTTCALSDAVIDHHLPAIREKHDQVPADGEGRLACLRKNQSDISSYFNREWFTLPSS